MVISEKESLVGVFQPGVLSFLGDLSFVKSNDSDFTGRSPFPARPEPKH